MCPLGIFRDRRVPTAWNVVTGSLVACTAGEIKSERIHMHIKRAVRGSERGIHVAVLDAITAATEEMARAACIAAGLAYALRNPGQVDGLCKLARTGRNFDILIRWVPCQSG